METYMKLAMVIAIEWQVANDGKFFLKWAQMLMSPVAAVINSL